MSINLMLRPVLIAFGCDRLKPYKRVPLINQQYSMQEMTTGKNINELFQRIQPMNQLASKLNEGFFSGIFRDLISKVLCKKKVLNYFRKQIV